MRVCVVGLGHIGLPLAVQFAGRGHQVRGADINPSVVDGVRNGQAPLDEPGVGARLRAALQDGMLQATTDTHEAVAASEVVLVVVPLVIDGEGVPDFSAIDAATADIASGLQPDTLVIYETTLPIGTTRGRLGPALAESGLVLGEHLFVCHSPERVSTGSVLADLRRYPKLVGGLDDASAARATTFYQSALDFDERPDLEQANGVWDLGSAEAAEFAKLMETTYRDVNIGLANQFARHADALGVDVAPVITAANSQPYSHIHRPGIAVGGHCIPVYPHLYLQSDPDATLVIRARALNRSMPRYVVDRLERRLGGLRDLHVCVLGASYRGGVKETAFSGVFDVVEALQERGAIASVHDPHYAPGELAGLGLLPYQMGESCDAAVVQADHPEYRKLKPADLPGAQLLFDGRNCVDPAPWRRDGHMYAAIGDGSDHP